MEHRQTADRIEHWPVLSSVHVYTRCMRIASRRSSDLFLFAHATQIHSVEIDSRIAFISIASI
jgi:hypothetical protein